jgi:hypothetical protein
MWLKEYESANHLDVMIFIIIFYPLAVEYLKWRLNL